MWKIIKFELQYTYRFIVPIIALIVIGFVIYQRLSTATSYMSLVDFPLIPLWCILPIPVLFFASITTFVRRRSYLERRTACGRF